MKNIICALCQTINRVPEQRFFESPVCGKCHKPLFTQEPLNLSHVSFERYTTKNDLPVVVDFWASWCGPCKQMAPAFKSASLNLSKKFRFAKLNTETEQTIAGQYKIRSIPTMIVFLHGKEIARQSGALSQHDISNWLLSVA